MLCVALGQNVQRSVTAAGVQSAGLKKAKSRKEMTTHIAAVLCARSHARKNDYSFLYTS